MKFILTILPFLFSFNLFAEQARLLDRYEQSLQARIDLAINAKKEILVSSYSFRGDELGKILLSVLHYQAMRGIKVKLLIDDMGSKIKPYLGTFLVNAGVDIEIFNPVKVGDLINGVKYRMHDKLFIVDGEHLIMGGRNSKNVYYGKGEINYKDRDIYLAGKIASTARDYYLKLIEAEHTKKFKTKTIKNGRDYKEIEKVKTALKNILKLMQDTGFEVYEGARSWEKDHYTIDNPRFVHDEITLYKKPLTGTTLAIMEQVKSAQKYVYIDSPYFILTKEWYQIFRSLRAKGVKVRFLTNSLMSTSSAFSIPQAGYLASKRKILALGIDLYEYYQKETLHAKTIVIDDQVSIIGSYNFDPRSQNLNTELTCISDDVVLAEKLKRLMDTTLGKARRIMPDGKPEGSIKEFPDTKRSKVIATQLVRYLIYPIFKDWF